MPTRISKFALARYYEAVARLAECAEKLYPVNPDLGCASATDPALIVAMSRTVRRFRQSDPLAPVLLLRSVDPECWLGHS